MGHLFEQCFPRCHKMNRPQPEIKAFSFTSYTQELQMFINMYVCSIGFGLAYAIALLRRRSREPVMQVVRSFTKLSYIQSCHFDLGNKCKHKYYYLVETLPTCAHLFKEIRNPDRLITSYSMYDTSQVAAICPSAPWLPPW
jgi:hypothetical protein